MSGIDGMNWLDRFSFDRERRLIIVRNSLKRKLRIAQLEREIASLRRINQVNDWRRREGKIPQGLFEGSGRPDPQQVMIR